MKIRSITFILTLFFAIQAGAQVKYMHCGTMLDMTSDEAKQEVTIVIEDGLISAVHEGYLEIPDGAEYINLQNATVMPGLMDMHVHIEGQSNPKRYEQGFRENSADVALRATIYCERTLMAGFTTVRDLGGSGVNVSLQGAIDRGYIVGPRIYTAEKAIGTTGGHADPTNGVRDDLEGDPGPKEGVINSPEEAVKAVRQRYKNGADCIKITATGGVLSVAKDGQGAQFTQEEVNAIVQAAEDYGYTTAAHAHGVEGMQRAIRAGITSIEHGTLMDEETMDLMIEHGTYLVPTVSAGLFVREKALIPGYFPPVIVPKALEMGQQIQETAGKAYRAGVKMAFGTDTGVSPHGDNAKEFIYLAEVGIPIGESLKMATVHAADLLRISDKYGTIEPGKVADIIATREHPEENIETLLDVLFVMKGGEVFKDVR